MRIKIHDTVRFILKQKKKYAGKGTILNIASHGRGRPRSFAIDSYPYTIFTDEIKEIL